jgi:uncharacterized protein (DUF4213/DUF364 family)
MPAADPAAQRQLTAAMSLGTDLIDAASRIAKALPLPPVDGLILPSAPAEAGKLAHFGVLVLADGSAGFFFTLLDHTLASLKREAGRPLHGRRALDLARGLDGGGAVERALALAAVNAVGHHLCRRAGYRPLGDTDPAAMLRLGAGDRVGMVGLFPPLLKRLAGADVTVVERDASLRNDAGGARFSADPAALRDCTKVLVTAATQINDSLDEVLAHCAGARRVAVVGPSAGAVPDALFRRGVDVVGSSLVEDLDELRRRLLHGQPWGSAVVKTVIERESYPGLTALLARAGGGQT